MIARIGEAQIGQWYQRTDLGQRFEVTGRDWSARTLKVRDADGRIDELQERDWPGLPLWLAPAPQQGELCPGASLRELPPSVGSATGRSRDDDADPTVDR